MEKSVVIMEAKDGTVTFVTGIVEKRTAQDLVSEARYLEERIKALSNVSSEVVADIQAEYNTKIQQLIAERDAAIEKADANFAAAMRERREAMSRLENLKAVLNATKDQQTVEEAQEEVPAAEDLLEGVKEKCEGCEAWSGTDCTRNPVTEGCLKDQMLEGEDVESGDCFEAEEQESLEETVSEEAAVEEVLEAVNEEAASVEEAVEETPVEEAVAQPEVPAQPIFGERVDLR